MISIIKIGDYQLGETKDKTNLLLLDTTHTFVWVHAQGGEDDLIFSRNQPLLNSIFAIGKYRLYEVHNEPALTNLPHLELLVGKGKWQGYILPTGLPDQEEKRKRSIPTPERITCSAVHCPLSPYQNTESSIALMF